MSGLRYAACCLTLLVGSQTSAIAQVTAAGAGTTVTTTGNTFTIGGGTVAEDNLFHELDQFDLTTGQTADFLSSPGTANIFGQVVGGSPSSIDGLLRVTGSSANLYLINPAGLLLGPNTRLDLSGSFTATTADRIGFGDDWLSVYETHDYTALVGTPDSYAFTLAESGAILSEGQLAVETGQAIRLIGGDVVNSGTLTAPNGEIVVVGVPTQHRLRVDSNSLLSLEVDAITDLSVADLPALLTGGGAGSEPTELLTRADGTVQIGDDCTGLTCAVVSGELLGGDIAVTAPAVSVVEANITAVTSSGGRIRIGGDARGEGPMYNAQHTQIDSASALEASATQDEHGGQIVVWAEDTARVQGSLTAENGFIETSGKRQIDLTGVRIRAAGGEWLIDPTDITIRDGATGLNEIAPATIVAQLDAGTDVTITTAGTGTDNGDIYLQDSITQTGSSTANLTLLARSIIVTGSTVGSVFVSDQQINLATTGTLTIGFNQVNPIASRTTDHIQNAFAVAGTLAGNLVIDIGSGTYTGDTIVVGRDATIRGQSRDTTFLDGQGANRLLEVLPGVSVTLENLRITDGATTGDGGAIFNQGNLTIDNSRISESSAVGNGGAIANTGTAAVLNLTNSQIIDNTALSGGGIYTDDGATSTISSSLIFSNTASENGGGLSASDSSRLAVEESTVGSNIARRGGGISVRGNSDLTLARVALNDNTATVEGGGLDLFQGDATINSVRFERNDADTGGGASIWDSTATVTNSQFNDNTAISEGGGLRSIEAVTEISNSSFTGNSANIGGGIEGSGPAVGPNTLTITSSAIENNTATTTGGGINNDRSSTLTITNVGLSNNQAGTEGGGIHNAGRLSFSGTVTNNTATRGGGIADVGGETTIQNSQISDNISSQDGGGLSVGSGGTLTLQNSEVRGNQAGDQGGGIYMSANTQLNTTSTTIANNQATSDGGGIANNGSGSTATINTTRISSNTSDEDGGGIYTARDSQTTVTNSAINNNAAQDNGGGFYVRNTSRLSLDATTVDSNSAGRDGGGIATREQGQVIITSSTLSNNIAGDDGGGLDLDSGTAAADTLSNLTLSGNQADAGAGLSIGSSVAVTVENATIANNQASGSNGGVSNLAGGTLSLQNSIVADNRAPINPDAGGVINSLGYNLVRDQGSSSGYVSTDLPNGADPNLGPLADNGGPTATHLIQLGSAAIDAGPLTSPLATDQRGESRLVGSAVDIGAIELGPQELPSSTDPTEIPLTDTTVADPRLDNPDRQGRLNLPELGATNPVLDEIAFQQLEQQLSESYEHYWSKAAGPSLTLQQVQEILQRAKQLYPTSPAAVYPIFVSTADDGTSGLAAALDGDGTEELALLLVPADGQPVLRRVGIDKTTVLRQARLFQTVASDPEDSQGYQALARQFYDWLLRPIEAELEQRSINQLIYVPDAGLRTLPLAAMHDGEQFAIEHYGLSMVPSMSLTQFGFDSRVPIIALAGGASEFEQLAALPGVAVELERIGAIAPEAEVLFNPAFTVENLASTQRQLQPSVLHLATHAEFTPGSPQDAYIQLWQTRLSMQQFKEQDWQGIELLILSACTTALGSTEAELGFAGLAMATGVESSVGSLWAVSDIATLALMEVFYQQLSQGQGRAEALQIAQQQLLRGEVYLQSGQLITPTGRIDVSMIDGLPETADFTHPFYWSAFVTVGNPWL